MKRSFNDILDTYIDNNSVVNSSTIYFNLIKNEIPKKLKAIVENENFKISGTLGQGNKADYPLISIFDKSVTNNSQNGFYIVYLFKKDMSGFYLSLNQGTTYYKEKYGNTKKMYEKLELVSSHFKEKILSNIFSKDKISLNSQNKDRGFGYEKGNIISKFYEKNKFTTDELTTDLNKMLEIYKGLIKSLNNESYINYISNLFNQVENIKKALITIDEATNVDTSEKTLIFAEPSNNRKSTKDKFKFDLLRKKKDYEQISKKNAITGLIGEELVLRFEMKRLNALGCSDLAEKIEWVSEKSDDYGYDIKSFDVIDNKVFDKFIEVKTSKDKSDKSFYISDNQIRKSQQFKDEYSLFRIYDVDSDNPKYYEIRGDLLEKLNLAVIGYTASIK